MNNALQGSLAVLQASSPMRTLCLGFLKSKDRGGSFELPVVVVATLICSCNFQLKVAT